MSQERVAITNLTQAEMYSKSAILGHSFLFLDRTKLEDLWQHLGTSPTEEKSILSLWGKENIDVVGCQVKGWSIPEIPIAAITSDKIIYTAGKDIVNLLVVYVGKANEIVEILIEHNEQLYANVPVMLNEVGMGVYRMAELYPGKYTVSLDGTSIRATFDVAKYQLAPFWARLERYTIEDNELQFGAFFTSFDVPYFGEVVAQLQVESQNVGEPITLRTDPEGRTQGNFTLPDTEGLVTINFQAKDSPEKTATVLVKGAQTEERSFVVLNPLGEVTELSLAPSEGAQAVYGAYLKQKGTADMPFCVLNSHVERGAIEVRQPIELAKLCVIDPIQKVIVQEQDFAQLTAGQTLHVDVPKPYGVVAIGAFINGEPWEGYTIFLHPSELSVQVEAKQEVEPGETIEVKVKTNQPERRTAVWLVVKDARLVALDPQTGLASAMKKGMEDYLKRCRVGTPEHSLNEFVEKRRLVTRTRHSSRDPDTIVYALSSILPSTIRGRSSIFNLAGSLSSRGSRVLSRRVSEFVESAESPLESEPFWGQIEEIIDEEETTTGVRPRQDFPEILYVDMFDVKGEATIPITLGDGICQYTIEVFAYDGLSWALASTSCTATKSLWAECIVPPFVDQRDSVWSNLYLSSDSGKVKLEATCDGQPLPMRTTKGLPSSEAKGQSISPDSIIDVDYTEVQFLTKPGIITVRIEDDITHEQDILEFLVTEPGKLRYMAKTLVLLQPGESIRIGEDGVKKLTLLPGLEKPFQTLVQSTISYQHACCEQTASRIVAAACMYLFAEDEAERQKAESYMLAGIKRQERMYRPKEGFTIYPERSEIYPSWSGKAACHLLSLGELSNLPNCSPALGDAVKKAQKMAKDVLNAHSIPIVPTKITTSAEAYRAFTYGTAEDKAKAIAFARQALNVGRNDISTTMRNAISPAVERNAISLPVQANGLVSSREETAYAAAILCANRQGDDFQRALKAANWLTAQLNEEGRLYSTVDSRAAIALTVALQSAGVVSSSGKQEVLINGVLMKLEDALKSTAPIEAAKGVDGVVAVETLVEREEDINAYGRTFPVNVKLEKDGNSKGTFKVGDAIDLVVEVDSYKPGLIAEVYLPACLAYIKAGAQVKRFSIDFAGEALVRIPLAAITQTQDEAGNPGIQHFAVVVRNMFNEEEISNPGPLSVKVSP